MGSETPGTAYGSGDGTAEAISNSDTVKVVLKVVTDELDHRHLNELPAFADHNPSSELLAQYVYHRMKDLLAGHPVRLEQVMVSEKSSSRAYYFEETD